MDGIFDRAELLLGEEGMNRLEEARVIVFGVGGVGSWCAECLVRTGVGHLTIVDFDAVAPSNVNRQLMATVKTIGRPKVEVLAERLKDINPEVDLTVIRGLYDPVTASSFDLQDYEAVVDCIDSLRDKTLLILNATRARVPLFSSMGAARKMDPTRIKVAEFGKVFGCPLARALRQRFKKEQTWPPRKFPCVFSDELVENIGAVGKPGEEADKDSPIRKGAPNGSLMHITAIFGITLAGLVIKHLTQKD